MTVNQIVMAIMAVFFVLGCLDRILGNRFGLGSELERGFHLMGSVSLTILGLFCIAPVLAKLLAPLVIPVYRALGADAAMFSGTFFAPDAGGYSIAAELAADPALALFSGLVVAPVMGSVVSFGVPLACGIIPREDIRYYAFGVLAAFVADPVGCFFGGLLTEIPAETLLRNLLPVLLVALLIALGLYLVPQTVIRVFYLYSRCLIIIITAGLLLATVEKLTGAVLLPGMDPIETGFQIVGATILVIAGALPLVSVLTRLFRRALVRLGRKTGIDETAMLGILLSTATSVPVYASFRDMGVRGKVIAGCFTASMGNLLGAQLGFVYAIEPGMVAPMLFAKVVAGALALPLCHLLARHHFPEYRTGAAVPVSAAEQA